MQSTRTNSNPHRRGNPIWLSVGCLRYVNDDSCTGHFYGTLRAKEGSEIMYKIKYWRNSTDDEFPIDKALKKGYNERGIPLFAIRILRML